MGNYFEIEKMNAVPGIYMIYNQSKGTIYIGQAKDLKERMKSHIKSLYENKDDNGRLQEEFEQGDNSYTYRVLHQITNEDVKRVAPNKSLKSVPKSVLNEMEGLYFQAAQRRLGNKVHNINQTPKRRSYSNNELDSAFERIKKKTDGHISCPTIKIHNKNEAVWKTNKDILDKDKDSIIQEAEKNLNHCRKDAKIELETISIKSLLENGRLNHIMIGKMGDYVGSERAQSFTEILIEKLVGIATQGKCMWITNCPNVQDTENFIGKYGFSDDGENNKVYALFALTSAKYNNEKPVEYYWEDSNHQKFTDTAPSSKRHRRKALIIDRFWLVEEDFDLDIFSNSYYRHMPARINGATGEHILNKPITGMSQMQPCCATLKKIIPNHPEMQEELYLDKDVKENFKKDIPQKDIAFYDSEGAVYYILAEVESSVWMSSEY